MTSTPEPRIQSVARAAEILFAVAASPDGLTPREVSDATGVRLQTIYHLLQTLGAVGLLRRDETGARYVTGYAVGPLAAGLERHSGVPEQVLHAVRAVAEDTGEAVYGSGWAGGELVVLARRPGTKPVAVTEMPLGFAGHGFARASGKLLLALANDQVRDAYLDQHPHRSFTANTLSRAALMDELEVIRAQGYAMDNEEYLEGVCCIAAPIAVGTQTFCITLSAPAERFRANEEFLRRSVLSETRERVITK